MSADSYAFVPLPSLTHVLGDNTLEISVECFLEEYNINRKEGK